MNMNGYQLYNITYRVRLGDTFSDNLLVTFLVAGISTIFTLISQCIEKEVVAERAQHQLIELLLDELVSIHFVNFAFPFSDRTLTTETARGIQRTLAHVLLDWTIM